jgi:hypothetical protein
VGLGLSAQIAGEGLSFRQGIKSSLLDPVSVLVETHVTQHHHGAEQKSGGVGKTLASDIGSGTVDSLEDGALVTDVAGGGQTKTTDETGAHVGENVTVQVGHDEDLVVVGDRVGNHLQAGVVEKLGIELDLGEVLGDILGRLKEQTVAHLHDGGLVDNPDLLAANLLGLLESEAEDTLASLAGDKLDALNDTIDNNVLDAGVFTLGVLTDQDGIDVIVGGLVAGNGTAGAQVGEKVEGTAESKVEGDMALSNGGSQGSLQGNLIPLDALNGSIRNSRLSVLQDGCNVAKLPGNRSLSNVSH